MRIMVTNIQRFSLHDGPGIRTTVFLKGCSLSCPWCANPENISFKKEKYYDSDKNEHGEYGYEISTDNLYKELIKDKDFYDDNGGVTFSGGEPLMHFDYIEPLLKKLNEDNINICIETCLFAPLDVLKKAIKYIDYFIVDCKILDKDLCTSILGGNISLYLNNLDQLYKMVENKNIIIRIPLINGFTNNIDNISAIISLMKKYNPLKIEIFSGHTMASKKYASLSKEILNNVSISDKELDNIKKEFENNNLNVQIIRI